MVLSLTGEAGGKSLLIVSSHLATLAWRTRPPSPLQTMIWRLLAAVAQKRPLKLAIHG
ncbi:MAG: hypothetical protein ACPGWR_13630 [Ardenticatenaceae bacterium]